MTTFAAGSAPLSARTRPPDTAALSLLCCVQFRAADPLVPVELRHRRTVLIGTTLMACAAGTLVDPFLLTSLLLQDRLGHSLSTGFLCLAVVTAGGLAVALRGLRAGDGVGARGGFVQ